MSWPGAWQVQQVRSVSGTWKPGWQPRQCSLVGVHQVCALTWHVSQSSTAMPPWM